MKLMKFNYELDSEYNTYNLIECYILNYIKSNR